jgi:hypothetical protein
MNRSESKIYKNLLLSQGGYFLLTGVWPLFSIESFMAITGPKVEAWLVQVAGVLIAGIGLSLLAASRDRYRRLPTLVLGMASAGGLLGVDVIFYLSGDIGAVYLMDAVVEFVFVALWIWISYWYWVEMRFREMV